MKILVSACLLGENCKYNGGNNLNEKLLEFLKDHEVIPVCPEVMGGLPVPRVPVELKEGIAINKNGENVHREFTEGAITALKIAKAQKIDFAILQSRSPSCGPKEIYDGTFSKKLICGQGIFASMLKEEGIRAVDIEEI